MKIDEDNATSGEHADDGGRERLLIESFTRLAGSLAGGRQDVVGLLDSLTDDCVALIRVRASCGILIAGADGSLTAAAWSDRKARTIEVVQAAAGEGPCVDAFMTRRPAGTEDLERDGERWPRLSEVAGAIGVRAIWAFPMELRDHTIGALNVFLEEPGRLGRNDTSLVRALAAVATVAIVQERLALSADELTRQLQQALETRVVIEQAKGILSARGFAEDLGAAFEVLRSHARQNNRRLSDVAVDVVEGRLFRTTT
jgi:GAF domain-containing protein